MPTNPGVKYLMNLQRELESLNDKMKQTQSNVDSFHEEISEVTKLKKSYAHLKGSFNDSLTEAQNKSNEIITAVFSATNAEFVDFLKSSNIEEIRLFKLQVQHYGNIFEIKYEF